MLPLILAASIAAATASAPGPVMETEAHGSIFTVRIEGAAPGGGIWFLRLPEEIDHAILGNVFEAAAAGAQLAFSAHADGAGSYALSLESSLAGTGVEYAAYAAFQGIRFLGTMLPDPGAVPGGGTPIPVLASVPTAGVQVIHDGPSTAVQFGDIDGDGDRDMAVTGGDAHGGVPVLAWYEQVAMSAWVRHDIAPALAPFTGDCTLVDIDGDGDLDFAVSVDQHSSLGPAAVYWYENDDPFGPWAQHVIEAQVPNAFHIGDMKSGDVDDDGKTDVVVRHLSTNRFVVYFQNGADSWTPLHLNTLHREGLQLADLDDDDKLDIIGNGFVLFAPALPRTGAWQFVDIDAAYHNLPQTDLNNSTKAGVADFNGDTRPDILFSVAEGGDVWLAWYEAPAAPRTSPWTKHIIESPLNNNHQAEIFDFDQDGDLDVLGGFAFSESGVHFWENLAGDGLSWARRDIFATINSQVQGCYNCQAGDFDQDGDVDFAGPSTYSGGGRVLLYENTLIAAPRPAYKTIPAEAADERSGVGIYSIASGGGLKIGAVDSGDWIGFDAISFSPSLAHKVTMRVSSNSSGGTIQVRLDSPTGPQVGTLTVPYTGGWDNFVEITAPITFTTGVRPLYLVFQGGGGALLDVDWVRFRAKVTQH